jgi:hypothetical protein
MADVIRRAIIEIETRQKRSRLEAPGQGFKAEAEAAKQAEKAIDSASESMKRHGEVASATAFTMAKGLREAGEGAFRAARGITLLASGGSDDLKRLVQHVALAQGAFDVFAGSVKAVTNLLPLLGGPATAAVVAVTGAAIAGIAVWNKYKVEARKALEEIAERSRRVTDQINSFNDVLKADNARRTAGSEARIGASLSEETRERRIREELAAEVKVGEKAARAAATDTSTGGEAKFKFVETNARIAEESLKRQIDLTKQLHDIEKARDAEKQQQLNAAVKSGASFFGIKGLPTGPEHSSQFDARTKDLERGLEAMVRMAAKFADTAEEMERKVSGSQFSK